MSFVLLLLRREETGRSDHNSHENVFFSFAASVAGASFACTPPCLQQLSRPAQQDGLHMHTQWMSQLVSFFAGRVPTLSDHTHAFPPLYSLLDDLFYAKYLLYPSRRPSPLAPPKKIDLRGTCDLQRALITATTQTGRSSIDLPTFNLGTLPPTPSLRPKRTTKPSKLVCTRRGCTSTWRLHRAQQARRTTPAARKALSATPHWTLLVAQCAALQDTMRAKNMTTRGEIPQSISHQN